MTPRNPDFPTNLFDFTRQFVVLMWLACYATGADLPADAQATVAKADKAIGTIQADAAFKVYKAQLAEIVALKRCEDAAMSRKDLDGATTIKARVDDLQKQVDDYNAVLTVADPPILTKAEYGVKDHYVDVTTFIKAKVSDGTLNWPLDLVNDGEIRASIGSDPAPNAYKEIRLTYNRNGVSEQTTFPFGSLVHLP